jgi:hypothetical protein
MQGTRRREGQIWKPRGKTLEKLAYLEPVSYCMQETGEGVRDSRGAVQNSKRGRSYWRVSKPKHVRKTWEIVPPEAHLTPNPLV